MLDVTLTLVLVLLLLGVLVPSISDPGSPFAGRAGDQLLTILALPFAMVVDSALYALCGNTLGKRIAGINVLSVRGERLTFRQHIARNFRVYIWGLAFGIGIVALFTLLTSHRRLKRGELLSWDEQTESRVFQVRPGAWRSYAVAITYIVIGGGLAALSILVQEAEDDPEKMLAGVAAAINMGAPKMVDEDTRLDSVVVEPARTLRYNFTLVHYSPEPHQSARFAELLNGELRRKFADSLCTGQDMKALRDLGTKLKYSYSDQSGRFIGATVVASDECVTAKP
jgi:hypothetical protein